MTLSSPALLALITGIVGLLSAAVLAAVNNWINARSGIDENLRTLRLQHYPALWAATAAAPRWPPAELTRAELTEFHQTLRSWYYTEGGIFMSVDARFRFGDVQELISAFLTPVSGNAKDQLAPPAYADLVETLSALRAALADDLDTRRRRSLWELRRRARRHAADKRAAAIRIARATQAPVNFVPAA